MVKEVIRDTPDEQIKVYVNGVFVDNVLLDSIPIPRLNTKEATIKYYREAGDEGQNLISKAAFDLKAPCLIYKVLVGSETWEYTGKISRYAYDVLTKEAEVDIEVYDDLTYTIN